MNPRTVVFCIVILSSSCAISEAGSLWDYMKTNWGNSMKELKQTFGSWEKVKEFIEGGRTILNYVSPPCQAQMLVLCATTAAPTFKPWGKSEEQIESEKEALRRCYARNFHGRTGACAIG